MDKFYSKAFKIGVYFNILFFVVLNCISFIVSRNNYLNALNNGIQFLMIIVGAFLLKFLEIALAIQVFLE